MGQPVERRSPQAVILSASGGSAFAVTRTAREQVAELIGAHSMDVIFTSCATGSNDTAVAAAPMANPTKRHIIISQVKHMSVLNYCKAISIGELTPRRGGAMPRIFSQVLQRKV